jgi:cation/acetate symporter
MDGSLPGWAGALISQPAAWSVPAAFTTMVVVSLLTPSRLPVHVARTMVRLHTPEAVELDRGPSPI